MLTAVAPLYPLLAIPSPLPSCITPVTPAFPFPSPGLKHADCHRTPLLLLFAIPSPRPSCVGGPEFALLSSPPPQIPAPSFTLPVAPPWQAWVAPLAAQQWGQTTTAGIADCHRASLFPSYPPSPPPFLAGVGAGLGGAAVGADDHRRHHCRHDAGGQP
ncbi:unnamed protein product [Closterium sp. Naga37s-1]|nr:unnamed protein product [Closterium sp. Naga37s-1]